MKIQARSYSSKLFRPKPHVHLEDDGSLLVIATSWGQPEHAALVADEIVKYVTAARGDVEVTSPFEIVPALSREANHLRIGTLIANEILYRGENKAQYLSGVEVLAVGRQGTQLAWAQVGAPHLLLRRQGRPLVPLATSFDHSFELSLAGQHESPLPSRLLGVDPSCHISSGDLQVSENDLLVLLASSMVPPALWTVSGPYDLQILTKHLVENDPDAPFWLALIDL